MVLWDAVGRKRLGGGRFAVSGASFVGSVAFSPDGKTIAAGYSGDVALLDVNLESWTQIAARTANRNFTRGEWRQYFPDQPYHATFPDLPVPPEAPRD